VYEKSGHGLFTYYLLRALDGAADISDNPNSPVGDCVITATELGNYLKEKVPEASNFSQSPLFNRISGEGEFIFIPPICKAIDPVDTEPPEGDESWTKTEAYKGPKELRYKSPAQVVVDQNENLYVLDTGLKRILKFDSEGQFLDEQLAEVAIDDSWAAASMAIGYGGDLWVYYSWTGKKRAKQDSPAGKLVVYNNDGSQAIGWNDSTEPLTACLHENGMEVPFPATGLIALDIEDNVVIVDLVSGVLTKCDRSGKLLRQWGKQEEHELIEDISRYKTVTNPKGLAIDMFGYIYVADTEGHGIQKYYDGEWIPSWPNVKGTKPHFFDSPHGLAVDNNLYVYVADTKNHRIKKYTSGGEKLLTYWGRAKAKKGKKYGEFNTPMGVALNWNSTNVYIADTGNRRVQKFIIKR
jgi:DNA-binding beta-propeller fold protein YncE